MTDLEIRLAIAALCGWKYHDEVCHGGRGFWTKGDSPDKWSQEAIPRYEQSLDAMHEAEKTICGEDFDTPMWLAYLRQLDRVINKRRAHATARQRAEAFLRVHDLWRE
jgi:hypothetical protein